MIVLRGKLTLFSPPFFSLAEWPCNFSVCLSLNSRAASPSPKRSIFHHASPFQATLLTPDSNHNCYVEQWCWTSSPQVSPNVQATQEPPQSPSRLPDLPLDHLLQPGIRHLQPQK